MKKKLRFRILAMVASVLIMPTLVGIPASATDVTPAIVGGHNATQQYGAVSIFSYDSQGVFRHRCTAALIRRDWVVTTAHCLNVIQLGVSEARTSALDTTSDDVEIVGLRAVYPHPGYNPDTNVDDIALVQLEEPITRTTPLELSTSSPAVGSEGKIAGWGWICEEAGDPDCGHWVSVLQELRIEVVDDARCGWLFDPANQLCGVAADGSNSMACAGDSGSPFVRKGFGNTMVLLGVAVGDGDYDIDHPNACSTNVDGGQGAGFWMDISHYRSWIVATIAGV